MYFCQRRGVLPVGPSVMRLFGDRLAHVPVGDELHAVGIGEDAEGDVVVEEAEGFGVGEGVELVDGLDELLGADSFGGVEAAVDPDDGAAFFGEGVGLVIGEIFGVGEFGWLISL